MKNVSPASDKENVMTQACCNHSLLFFVFKHNHDHSGCEVMLASIVSQIRICKDEINLLVSFCFLWCVGRSLRSSEKQSRITDIWIYPNYICLFDISTRFFVVCLNIYKVLQPLVEKLAKAGQWQRLCYTASSFSSWQLRKNLYNSRTNLLAWSPMA